MIVQTYPDYNTMCRAAADIVVAQIKLKPNLLMCCTSGDTPAGIYRFLVEDARQGKVDFSNCYFVGLDEWVGMDKNDAGSCTNFLFEMFFTPLNIDLHRTMFFDAKANDLDAACKAMDEFIKPHAPFDIMLVGLGVNGHIGLNEPGTGFDKYSRCGDLADVTIAVGQKYFKTETPLTKGITLGLKYLQEAKIPMLIASGSKKAAIVAKALKGEITEEVPASVLQKIPQAYVMLDKEAAAQLSS